MIVRYLFDRQTRSTPDDPPRPRTQTARLRRAARGARRQAADSGSDGPSADGGGAVSETRSWKRKRQRTRGSPWDCACFFSRAACSHSFVDACSVGLCWATREGLLASRVRGSVPEGVVMVVVVVVVELVAVVVVDGGSWRLTGTRIWKCLRTKKRCIVSVCKRSHQIGGTPDSSHVKFDKLSMYYGFLCEDLATPVLRLWSSSGL